jgi:hypothetical protein
MRDVYDKKLYLPNAHFDKRTLNENIRRVFEQHAPTLTSQVQLAVTIQVGSCSVKTNATKLQAKN